MQALPHRHRRSGERASFARPPTLPSAMTAEYDGSSVASIIAKIGSDGLYKRFADVT